MPGEEKDLHLPITLETTIIPHSFDGKHSVEIVLTDTRWPESSPVPRPSLTVELSKPYDPITGELDQKLKAVFGRNVLNFAALGVLTTLAQQKKAQDEKAASEPEKAPPMVGEDGKPLTFDDMVSALQTAGIELSASLKKEPR